jgi:2',3'-cyclic-nucleotide 2'-phosphodiesterase (5'-nucleotidase family)
VGKTTRIFGFLFFIAKTNKYSMSSIDFMCKFAGSMKRISSIYLFASLLLAACTPSLYQTGKLEYARYDIKPGTATDSSVANMLAPYSTKIAATMYEVIGKLDETLEKKQSENSLGFFMTDAILAESRRVFNTQVDIALVNYGGIRTNAMQAGNITLGNIYELMPFDNLLVLITLDGKQVQQLLSHIAARGGWPISGGSFVIKNKTATEVSIGGQPLKAENKYTIAVSDYVANGGDDCSFLTTIPQTNNGYLLRDAIIGYVKSVTAAGKTVSKPLTNRVMFAQ